MSFKKNADIGVARDHTQKKFKKFKKNIDIMEAKLHTQYMCTCLKSTYLSPIQVLITIFISQLKYYYYMMATHVSV